MTANCNTPDRELVQKLESLALACLSLRRQSTGIAIEMADMGVMPSSWPPRVSRTDSSAVVRLKEKAIALHGTREKMISGIQALGARVLDPETMELVMPGGPTEGSVLSWQPGETAVVHWRQKADTEAPRQKLAGTPQEPPNEALH